MDIRSISRDSMLQRVQERKAPWDMLVIGGGATGVGIAVDAASRGYDVVLLEQHDFGKGTSSRSTKLVHGGVRYLEQGNIPLVRSALRERGLLRKNAPHLVHNLAFMVPSYTWWEAPFYGLGLKVYDLLAGHYGFGSSRWVSKDEALKQIPNLKSQGLKGGVIYFDGQFDDARLLVNLMQTAVEHGAVLLNYCPVVGFSLDNNGHIASAAAQDVGSGAEFTLSAKVIINATGAFADAVRRLNKTGNDSFLSAVAGPKHTIGPAFGANDPKSAGAMPDPIDPTPIISPSQGAHIVLPKRFLSGNTAVMVPHTSDERVIFAIPWHDHLLVGTTDTPIAAPILEPKPLEQEIDFLIETVGRYFNKRPTRADILSVFAGVRPLVKISPTKNAVNLTANLSRDHAIHVDKSGLLTICGGKWTTYRQMAEDCINHAIRLGKLVKKPCITEDLHIHGYVDTQDGRTAGEAKAIAPTPFPATSPAGSITTSDLGAHAPPRALTLYPHLSVYGSDAEKISKLAQENPEFSAKLHPDLPYIAAEVIWAVRHEMARTVEDVLARRLRALFLNAHAAREMAPGVASLMAKELRYDEQWQAKQVEMFSVLTRQYLALK